MGLFIDLFWYVSGYLFDDSKLLLVSYLDSVFFSWTLSYYSYVCRIPCIHNDTDGLILISYKVTRLFSFQPQFGQNLFEWENKKDGRTMIKVYL